MIIIQVAGGLGNQLQQYALYRKFLKLGIEACLDISWFNKQTATATSRELELLFFQQLHFRTCDVKDKFALIGSDSLVGKLRRKLLPNTIHRFDENKMYHPEIFQFHQMYISGYFACEKYYADILGELREEICFKPSTNPENQTMADKIKECNAVSVHIRRGDYLNPENAQLFGNICTDAYYSKALETIKSKVPNAHFFLFSDDIPYVTARYSDSDYTIVNINHGADSIYDMWLMSLCKHHICANSTFSFWGARLNKREDKIMIRPTIQKNTQVFVENEMKDWWKDWTFIDANGNLY